MPWIEAMLRGQRVLARAGADRGLAIERGRVEIRYGAGSTRLYHAAARNLEVAPGAKILDEDVGMPASVTASASRAAPVQPPVGSAWIAYTDGACSGNPGPAGCGLVLVSPEGKVREGFEYIGEATNNVAELTAILRAVEAIPPGPHAIIVHTDSQYAIGVIQKGWKAKANREIVAQTKRLVGERGARLVYVPGHQGVPLNERADALARESIQVRRNRLPPA
ncbi:MAG: ribonuclease HI [Polyangiaceae bacterium]